jgi:hypothetical protein
METARVASIASRGASQSASVIQLSPTDIVNWEGAGPILDWTTAELVAFLNDRSEGRGRDSAE